MYSNIVVYIHFTPETFWPLPYIASMCTFNLLETFRPLLCKLYTWSLPYIVLLLCTFNLQETSCRAEWIGSGPLSEIGKMALAAAVVDFPILPSDLIRSIVLVWLTINPSGFSISVPLSIYLSISLCIYLFYLSNYLHLLFVSPLIFLLFHCLQSFDIYANMHICLSFASPFLLYKICLLFLLSFKSMYLVSYYIT